MKEKRGMAGAREARQGEGERERERERERNCREESDRTRGKRESVRRGGVRE